MNSTEAIWRKATLPANASIQQAISNLDQVAIKIVLVVNEAGELEGTITDGDIRRGLLKGLDLNSSITDVTSHLRCVWHYLGNTVKKQTLSLFTGTLFSSSHCFLLLFS